MEVQLLREFEGEHDLEGMHAVSNASRLADGMDMVYDIDTFRGMYAGYMESLPSLNVIVAETEGRIVGHAMVWWRDVAEGQRLYSHQNAVLPGFAGTREKLMKWAETRLGEIASAHPPDVVKILETQAVPGSGLDSLVKAGGYAPARYFFEMLRPLEYIQEAGPPDGISAVTVPEKRLEEAWAVSREAFRDQWGYSEKNWSDERLEEMMESSLFDRSLWFVAVADGAVVGSVRNYIKPGENAMLNRRRGYISNICVLKPWRRRGIAAALLSKSMAGLAARGMTEARLGVDSESPTGALGLYRKAGFAVSNTYVSYRKPLRRMPDSIYP